VVIVGGGTVGASIARALTQRDADRVVVLERDTVGAGGTGKSSGVIRCHYGVPELAQLAWQSTALFEQAEQAFGTDVGFHQVGYVVGVAEQNVEPLRQNIALQRGLGIDTQLVDHATVRELWPGIDLTDIAALAYEPHGGYGDPYRTATAMAAQARTAGAIIEQGVTATELLLTDDGSKVTGIRAGQDEISAPVVILAAGAWSVPLAEKAGISLPIRAQRAPIVLVKPEEPLPVTPPVFSDLVRLQYSRPEPSGELLLGNSDHSHPEYVDPDHYSNHVETDYLESAVGMFADRFPALGDAAVSSAYAGVYDVTPDYNPILGPTDISGLQVAAGFSGHGFKISPAVGELIAELVCENHAPRGDFDPAVFRLSRFAEESPLTSRYPYLGAAQMR
jgi:glycine/D-amino acid oxidase-like deaminating enzyme